MPFRWGSLGSACFPVIWTGPVFGDIAGSTFLNLRFFHLDKSCQHFFLCSCEYFYLQVQDGSQGLVQDFVSNFEGRNLLKQAKLKWILAQELNDKIEESVCTDSPGLWGLWSGILPTCALVYQKRAFYCCSPAGSSLPKRSSPSSMGGSHRSTTKSCPWP